MSDLFLTRRWFDIPENAKNHLTQIELLKHLDFAVESPVLQNITLAAGRRSYKTERMAKRWGVKTAIKYPNKKIWYGAPTQGQGVKIFWEDLKGLINPAYIKNKSETKHEIELWNNTKIELFGLKEYERIEGQRADICIVTETQQCEMEAYSQTLQPILNDSNGVFLFEGRPFGKNHFYDFYMKGVNKERNWYSAWWSAEDILSDEQIQAAKETLSLIDYQREYQASFETGTSTVYYSYSKENNKKHIIDTNKPIIIACDFNATDKPMSWAIGQANGNNTYWTKTFQYQYTNTETMSDIVYDYLKENYKDKPLHIIFYGDYAGTQNKSNSSQTDWEIIEKKFRNIGKYEKRIKPCLSIRDSVGATNALLCNANNVRRMLIDYENCKELAIDWQKAEWKDNSREIKEVGMIGHLCRAIDYYSDYEFPITGKPKITHRFN